MSASIIALVTLLVLLLGLASGIPIAFAVGTAGLLAYFVFQEGTKGLQMAGSVPWYNAFSYTLLAVPVFVFMGHILDRTGVIQHLFRAVSNSLGRVPGSLAIATLITSGGLAAACGSGAATQATMATIAWPQLKRYGYSPKLSTAMIVGGGSLGPLIPPSGALIVYGALTGQSVAKLFMAALIPGIITMLMMIVYVTIRANLNPSLAPPTEPAPMRERLTSLIHVAPFALVIFGVLGGMYLGWATPTEAASVGVGLSFLLMLLYRRFNIKALTEASRQAVLTSGFIILIVVFALTMSSVLIYYGFPQTLASLVKELNVATPLVFAILLLIYIILGCFIDGLSIMVLTVPLLAPFLQAIGIDLIWFGVIIVILIEIGTMTPPFGLHVYIVHGVTHRPLEEIFRSVAPFAVIWFSVIILLWFFPSIALWLPGTMK